jgi:hypothetical protein
MERILQHYCTTYEDSFDPSQWMDRPMGKRTVILQDAKALSLPDHRQGVVPSAWERTGKKKVFVAGVLRRRSAAGPGCAFRKSYPDVMLVQPRQDWGGYNAAARARTTGSLNGKRLSDP